MSRAISFIIELLLITKKSGPISIAKVKGEANRCETIGDSGLAAP